MTVIKEGRIHSQTRLGKSAEYGSSDLGDRRARDPDDAHAAATRWGRNGSDGI